MGKRIADLGPLDDTPIASPEAAPRDDRDQPWYQFVGTIDALLGTGEYDWAFDTLTGIRETVEKTRRVSEGQRRAVANVEMARGLDSRRRRYEGFRGRWS